jgi:hypothetical protein
MLDDPEKTRRLLAALKASLPFEVHLTPPLARLLRAEHVALGAGDRRIRPVGTAARVVDVRDAV